MVIIKKKQQITLTRRLHNTKNNPKYPSSCFIYPLFSLVSLTERGYTLYRDTSHHFRQFDIANVREVIEDLFSLSHKNYIEHRGNKVRSAPVCCQKRKKDIHTYFHTFACSSDCRSALNLSCLMVDIMEFLDFSHLGTKYRQLCTHSYQQSLPNL